MQIWIKTDLWFGKWHEEYAKFSPKDLKVSGLGLWWESFVQNRKCMSLKITVKLSAMTNKNDAKFVEELTGRFKIDTKIWWMLAWALECLKNLQFNGLRLTKVYNFWAKKLQKSYVWWHWRLIQNLKVKWLVLSKMTWGIWQILAGWKNSKMAELNQNKNLKRLNRPDAVRKIYFTLEIIE